MRLDGCADALCGDESLRDVCIQEEGRELFTAEARGHVARTQGARDDRPYLFQGLLAREMAVGVVDHLKMVQVHHQDAEGARVEFSTRSLPA